MKTLLKDTTLPEDLLKDLSEIGFQWVEQLYESLLKDPNLMSRYLLKFGIDYDDLMTQVKEYL